MDPLPQPPNSKFNLLWKIAYTLMMLNKKDIPKRKLLANKSNEYGYKYPQLNIGKLN